MFLDADDLLSNRLPELCNLANHDAICFQNGYSWVVGSEWLQHVPHFHRVCGTSWIMRLGPRNFPDWLGEGTGTHRVCDLSHCERHSALLKENARIQTIREPIAIYRVGHQSTTDFGGMLRQKTGAFISQPLVQVKSWIKNMLRRQRLTAKLRFEFSLP